MAEPYVGEIKMFGGSFAPLGWVMCDGQLLDISSFQTLYTLIGTTYGGDGQTNFRVPDLRGRVPFHTSNTYPLGATGGTETVTLTNQQMPAHTHTVNANKGTTTTLVPNNSFWSGNTDLNCYSTAVPQQGMSPSAIGPAGGSQPHDNMMPFLAVSFIMATEGLYPSS